jgi:hypothetical protein
MSPRFTAQRVSEAFHGASSVRRAIWIVSTLASSGLLLGAIHFVGNLETKAHADSTFVRRDSLALQHLRDSTTAAAERAIDRAILFGLDSSDRCKRGQRDRCR